MKTNLRDARCARLAARMTVALLLLLPSGCEMPELEMDDAGPAPIAQHAEEDSDAQADADQPEPPREGETREFTANEPKRGKKSRAVGGYAGAVFGARFWAEHQMIINQITQALNLYNASNGFYPKTQEEFDEKIINQNYIKLPELDEGQEYFYDPEEHKLMVRPTAE